MSTCSEKPKPPALGRTQHVSMTCGGRSRQERQIVRVTTRVEIILDLPFGFPINNIISLYQRERTEVMRNTQQANSTEVTHMSIS